MQEVGMTVDVEKLGPVTVLTLNRPEARNAVDAATAVALADAIDAFAADDTAHVLVVTGAGGVAFCAGADLKGVDALMSHPRSIDAGPMGFAALDPGKPTIAAIDGYCFAGAMELAVWCDFRIAGEQSEFGALNRRWGVPFFDGGTTRLPAALGMGNALWLMETGIRINAARAQDIGLVQEVVPAGTALDRALTLAEEMAAYPQTSLRSDRELVLASAGRTLAEGLAVEAKAGRDGADRDDVRDRLSAFAGGSRPASPRMND
jgi:enoyl-CoA hydratase